MTPHYCIATRGSPLARAQTEVVRRAITAAHPDLAEAGAIDVVVIKTTGDKIGDRALHDIGGKGLFAKEIEEALLAGRVDMAVHSMKDVPTVMPDGLVIACLLPREDPRDVWIARDGSTIAEIAPGAVVGSASLRRAAQVLCKRPDLRVATLRGNVHTRLRKLGDGAVDATLLARAGLRRLGLEDEVGGIVLEPAEFLPAVAQGAIGVECRRGDARVFDLLRPLNDTNAEITVGAERALLAALDGSCRTPIGGLAETDDQGGLRLRALVAAADGSVIHREERQGRAADAERIGDDAGRALRALADPALFN